MSDFRVHYANDVLLVEKEGRFEQGHLIPGVDYLRRQQYGRIGPAHAWALDNSGRLHLIDIAARTVEIVAGNSQPLLVKQAHVLADRSSASLFLITQGREGLLLETVRLSGNRLVRSYPIPGRWTHCKESSPVLTADGKILLPIGQRADSGPRQVGILSLDPSTGHHEDFLIPPDDFRQSFFALSPDGRYCLRPDLSLLPSDSPGGFLKLLGGGQRPRRFGLSLQLWETRPLTFVRRLTIAWFAAKELPHEQYHGRQGPLKKPLSFRAELFGLIADRTRQLALGPRVRPRSSDFPEPYCSNVDEWGNLTRQWEHFVSGWAHNFVWSEDSQCFWHSANGLLACTSLDGRSTPRLLLERFGYNRDTWLPTTAGPLRLEALPGQQARLFYPYGSAVVSAPLSFSVKAPLEIPKDSDRWEPVDQAAQSRLYAEAARVKRRARLVEIPLASLAEADCLAAIEALRLQLGPNFLAKANEGEINVDFLLPGQVMGEADFFAHVESSCPHAAPALRGLLTALCALPGLERLELFSDGGLGIGIFSHAARAFAKLDPDPWDLLKAYGRVMDVEHETSFMNSVVPAALANVGWNDSTIDFAVWLIAANFYNSMDHRRLWEDWGLRQAVESRYRPAEFAFELERLLESYAQEPMEPGRQYRFWILDALDRDFSPKSPWTTELFASLKLPSASRIM